MPNSSLSNGYVQDYSCQGADLALLKDMKLSFPSAHASFAIYAALFFVLYTHVRVSYRGVKLGVPAAQLVVALAAWYTALSRVAEHMHHWGDVAAGILIGALYAVLVFIFVLKPQKLHRKMAWVEDGHPQMSLPQPVIMSAR
ncbi:Putative phosphatidate phosphatase [Eumeta japonica]|uniref:Phosphatidate phosphatase n=1 Tax=Eumeta variegata TaxID=151549 RepID=A0A4C1ULD5_EUMVA|nr:Putative phosphatidate phosphatase [Eumeta japonica]